MCTLEPVIPQDICNTWFTSDINLQEFHPRNSESSSWHMVFLSFLWSVTLQIISNKSTSLTVVIVPVISLQSSYPPLANRPLNRTICEWPDFFVCGHEANNYMKYHSILAYKCFEFSGQHRKNRLDSLSPNESRKSEVNCYVINLLISRSLNPKSINRGTHIRNLTCGKT